MTFIGVCGGRDYQNRLKMHEILVEATADVSDVVIVHGCARGADALASEWAIAKCFGEVRVPALWDQQGKAAGHRRNAIIAELPLSLLVAFPGGAGTASMIRMARAKGIDVLEVAP